MNGTPSKICILIYIISAAHKWGSFIIEFTKQGCASAVGALPEYKAELDTDYQRIPRRNVIIKLLRHKTLKIFMLLMTRGLHKSDYLLLFLSKQIKIISYDKVILQNHL